MDLSIVIPAFREAAKIRRDVEAAGAFLAQAGLTGEIIVVDDGSPDGTSDSTSSACCVRAAKARPSGPAWPRATATSPCSPTSACAFLSSTS
jgi:hypothetical protein